jgi:hypothetical protein
MVYFFLFLCIFLQTLCLTAVIGLTIQNFRLQRKLSVVETLDNRVRKLEEEELTDWKDRLKQQFAASFARLEKELAERIRKLEEQTLTREQLDWKDQVKQQFTTAFKQAEGELTTALKEVKEESSKAVLDVRKDFEGKLKKEFDKACEKIHFDEIEYKKSITKKRKEFSRKHGHEAKPQRIWRRIDEE